MLSPDIKMSFPQQNPRGLREELSEMRKGVLRVDVESPFNAVKRLHEAKRALSETPEIPGPITIYQPGFGDSEPTIIYIPNQAAQLKAIVDKGPGLKRSVVLFDTLRIPLPEARRSHNRRRDDALFRDLRQMAQDDTARLSDELDTAGEAQPTFLEAIAEDEAVVRGLSRDR
mgnify:CR=1 FL=1